MIRTTTLANRRHEEREPFTTEAEIYLESSVFRARLVDVSDGGVRFAVPKAINVHVRFKIGEKRISRNAQLIWCGRNTEDGLDYGFTFIQEE